mmetsp:Transcript_17491/g.20035  ORF Transcript_17491/g.20035 Transcript_17491/m.20035 type:complete len:303 (-) Transcript_17491:143-1051(-)
MKTASSLLLLLLVAASLIINTTHAITRRFGSTHHSLDLGSSPLSSSTLSSSRSISALGLQLSDTATIARTQQERRRRYSPATSSNKSTATTTTSTVTASTPAEQVRGGGGGVIKKQFGDGVCVDNEGNLYSSPSSFSASTLIAASALKVRGGGVCVDNEGNFYSLRSATVAAPQQEQDQIQRSQPSSLVAANHRRTILASSKSSASRSSTSKTAIQASSGAKQGQLGLGRRQTSSSPFFRSPTPPIRGGELKNNMNQHRIGDLCVDQEGNLYSSLTTLRGGGNGGGSGGLCVDNEGNLYASP